MKTEKRLTMALSVLVALMMLAVPLASSSNLFVDGGQTNSNGDAPMLSAAGDTLTINLNIPENSLDSINYDKLKGKLTTPSNVVYSIDANTGVIRAICTTDDAVTIKSVLDAIESALKNSDVAKPRMDAYTLKWSGDYTTVEGNIDGQMTVNATWKLNSTYAEVTFNTSGLAENTSMIKAYLINNGNVTVEFPEGLAEAANGYIVNLLSPDYEPVYNHVVKTSNGTIVKDNDSLNAKGDLTLSVTYTFNDLAYGIISVTSPIFDKAVTFYVAKTTDAVDVAATTYCMIFNALIAEKYLSDVKDSSEDHAPITKLEVSTTFELPLTANDGSCEINSWTNGSENYALNSNSAIAVGSELTLNAEFTTFPVKFMVNGQAQIVEVKYGEFSESSCPFDTTGMTVWVSVGADGKSIFNFDRSTDELQNDLKGSGDTSLLTLIALFSAYDETKYVTFNAGTGAYFGDKKDNITEVIVPVANGTTADKIPMPANPSKDADGISYLFAYWGTTGADDKLVEYTFDSKNKVTGDLSLTAGFVDYKFTINLFVDNNKYATIYCNDDVSYNKENNTLSGISGVDYEGKMYIGKDTQNVVSKAVPVKAGYNFVQWNDKDGKMMFVFNLNKDDATFESVKEVGFSKISANTDLYAEFDAAEYVIIYSGNTAAATNNMIQVGTVGESLNFFSDSTFSNDGYKLKEWNTRPDGKGTTYALGSAYTLSGADYDKLSKISTVNGNVPEGIDHGFTLYAIWEKTSNGSVTPGDNTDGDNDNSNTDTYLLAGILVVIIILIIVVAVVLRKKN